MSTRAYLPATLPLLAAYAEAGSVPADVEKVTAVDELEESEYAALTEAADSSVAMLGAHGRRVVIVADVDDLVAAVPWRLVRAVHADTEEVDTSSPEDLGDLGWFAVQEIPDLLAAGR